MHYALKVVQKMLYLSLASAMLLIAGNSGPSQNPKQSAIAAGQWKSVETKIGVLISAPVELGLPPIKPLGLKAPPSESYSLKAWTGNWIAIHKKVIAKTEDPEDSLATKLEDVAFKEFNLGEDRISAIRFLTVAGWPALDVEGKRGVDNFIRIRVCRAKTCDYELIVAGPTTPEKDALNKLFDSFRPPKAVGAGKLTAWGPTGQTFNIGKGHISIWSPVALKDSDDVPDFSRDDVTPIGYAGEFGYLNVSVAFVELPGSMEDLYDEDAIDKLITLKFGKNDDGDEVKFSEFKTYKLGKDDCRTVTFSDDTAEGRIDVIVKEKRLYVFAASVPAGQMDCEDIKRFFTSITIK